MEERELLGGEPDHVQQSVAIERLGEVLEGARGMKQRHQEHHAQQQQHGVGVDRGDGLLLAVEARGFARDDHGDRAAQGRDDAVHPLPEDHDVGADQDGRRQRHVARFTRHHALPSTERITLSAMPMIEMQPR